MRMRNQNGLQMRRSVDCFASCLQHAVLSCTRQFMLWDHVMDWFLFTIQLNALGNEIGATGPLLAAGVGVTDVKRLYHRLQVQDESLCLINATFLCLTTFAGRRWRPQNLGSVLPDCRIASFTMTSCRRPAASRYRLRGCCNCCRTGV